MDQCIMHTGIQLLIRPEKQQSLKWYTYISGVHKTVQDTTDQPVVQSKRRSTSAFTVYLIILTKSVKYILILFYFRAHVNATRQLLTPSTVQQLTNCKHTQLLIYSCYCSQSESHYSILFPTTASLQPKAQQQQHSNLSKHKGQVLHGNNPSSTCCGDSA